MISTLLAELNLITAESNSIQMRSLNMTRVRRIFPERVAMIAKQTASLLRRVCGSAGVTVLGCT